MISTPAPQVRLEFAGGGENTGPNGLLGFGRHAVFIGEKRLIQLIAVAGLAFALAVGPPSASRAEDTAPAASAEDAKAPAKDAEPTTTKDPQIALDDLELLLQPMTT